ncbi:hypothetical protein [uncultured Roseobacter sp.]|uniref:hypothetical protein n=1 Tax=uncultured Roseobacter sp. TaxID=114847 RepID=UPI0026331ECC|nr:hypothetical protein [uncultured Roseobacter sp.]
MKIVFSASNEDPALHLVDRKLISARFTRLVSLVAAGIDGKDQMPATVRKFMRDTENAIKDVLEQHKEKSGEPPVDEALNSISLEVNKRTNGEDHEHVAAGSAVFEEGAKQFSCAKCSAHTNRVCRGRFSDWKLFVDGEAQRGGLCVEFIRELTELLSKFAEAWFDTHCQASLRDPPEKIVICLDSLDENHDGTMPLDGSYDPDKGLLVVQWPTDPDNPNNIDEAILMLPYLLFHEVFVHGGQGRALESSIGDVPFSCSFTEGAVDAAARDLLVAKVLPDLPSKSFRQLRMQAQDRCNDYGQKRAQLSRGMAGSSDSKRKNEKISNARAFGTLMVWEQIKNFELHVNKPATWKFELLTALNLHMDLEQRDKFMECADFWEGLQSSVKDDVVNIFDTFLEDRQVNDLLRRLDQFGTP